MHPGILQSNDELIPTGELANVEGTPFDFRKPTVIGARIDQVGGNPVGYDHNYVLDGVSGEKRLAAKLMDPKSGRSLSRLPQPNQGCNSIRETFWTEPWSQGESSLSNIQGCAWRHNIFPTHPISRISLRRFCVPGRNLYPRPYSNSVWRTEK